MPENAKHKNLFTDAELNAKFLYNEMSSAIIMKIAMSIAGFDPTSGAGIIRDAFVMRDIGVHPLCVVGSLTVQNLGGVKSHFSVDTDLLKKQILALLSDFDVRYVKTGMLGSVENAKMINEIATHHNWFLVVDPLFHSKNGLVLNTLESVKKVIEVAGLITPNIPEAETLANTRINNLEDMENAALKINEEFGLSVLIKGGHMQGVDVLYHKGEFHEIKMPHLGRVVHGTGCTYSAAITAYLASGENLVDAVSKARAYLQKKIEDAVFHKRSMGLML